MPRGGLQRVNRQLPSSIEPMEACSVDVLPDGDQWIYEPKWDGFRCLMARDGPAIALRSKSGEDLTRYFPELVQAALEAKPAAFMLDGELVVPCGKTLSFHALLKRIHPAASRIARLARETPAIFVAFDLLAAGKALYVDAPLVERRQHLETFFKTLKRSDRFALSVSTTRLATARRWLMAAGGGFDGVVAKRADLPYQAGNRDGMQKIKRYRSADCVIGGFRYTQDKQAGRNVIGSLLLGLYDDAGLLHHVGFTSAFRAGEKLRLTGELVPLSTDKSFSGTAPGGPSRWSARRSSEWVPLKPKLVIEVLYDHLTGGRFRHGTKILRWRPDKRPRQCTFEQLH
ncbi:ATP-dependent DNA ligase [Bradyrhizobium sp. TZ2]